MISAQAAFERLREGNQRFVSGMRTGEGLDDHQRRAELVAQQQPLAIVLGCSDSRVPVEMVFDQGLGDLFVIRVAGNIVAPSQLASVEFAAGRFGTPLVVVLGHSRCGAIMATVEELQLRPDQRSQNLRSVVERVRPSVEGLLQTDLRDDLDVLVDQAIRDNVMASVRKLEGGSDVLRRLVRDNALRVVGAQYSLETGAVEFFDSVGGGPRKPAAKTGRER